MDSDEQLANERLGEVLDGRFELERLLGLGGMAAVYAARDSNGKRCAVKVLHAEMNRRADIRERFLREGEAATLVGHPGVVEISEAKVAKDGTAYLVMELLDGESLSSVIEQGGLPPDRLLDVLDQLLDVLVAAHEKKIVHRDLKPDNLFLLRDGRVKVLDFGIARVDAGNPPRHKTKTGVALGTVPYMAPEQALAKRDLIDGRTDLFSVGAMAFRILAGRPIHVTETEPELLIAMASKPAPPLRSVAPDVTPHLAAIVDVALAFARESRYPDARTMQSDVRAVRASKPPPFAVTVSAARGATTRVDLVAPQVAVMPGSGVTVPEATGMTEPDIEGVTTRGVAELAAARPSRAPTKVNEAHRAATVQGPSPSARTVPMPVDPTQVAAVAPAPPPRSAGPKSVSRWLVGGGVLLCAGLAGAFVLSNRPEAEAVAPLPAHAQARNEPAGARAEEADSVDEAPAPSTATTKGEESAVGTAADPQKPGSAGEGPSRRTADPEPEEGQPPPSGDQPSGTKPQPSGAAPDEPKPDSPPASPSPPAEKPAAPAAPTPPPGATPAPKPSSTAAPAPTATNPPAAAPEPSSTRRSPIPRLRERGNSRRGRDRDDEKRGR